ncbi:hypothetical protein BCR33DRAFT_720647 [Rhizoclosmatium globosum]|uniref:G-protein coupled receptors family 3 profile domain-containing protein n=1 Tax=Rhizoclosmatium globosum TaxID=329046 RepID=A0A1Y2BVD4_9FUNG|nr:hypothetical protein BCR33DRAFT_720647 [Rhizoclosmatium globosum]|eukprot:ORY38634.1 hypothetical protein BCR33DRAFT_720647 [Rhizoclosmatium globosum]
MVYNPINNIECWVIQAVSIVQLVLLSKLIHDERPEPTWDALRKVVTTPFNLMLVIMILVVAADYLPTQQSSLIYNVFGNILFYTFQVMCLWYTWLRGVPVVRIMIPKAKFVVIVGLVAYMFVISITCVFIGITNYTTDLTLLNALNSSFVWLNGISGSIALLLDMFVITVYSLYLRSIRKNGFDIDTSRERLLCRYGIAGALWVFILESSTVAGVYLSFYEEPPLSVGAWVLIWSLQTLSPSFYLFVQLSLKRALLLNKGRSWEDKMASSRNNSIQQQPLFYSSFRTSNVMQHSSIRNDSLAIQSIRRSSHIPCEKE